ncbi:MAG: hypothetical protein HUK08_04735 [Bacteroidaceae bacterium]|nr:hypothetical protein [Bacteroidaceae bacterium]
MSAVIGTIPFLIDGPDEQSFWFPLAVGTIGGLAFSIAPLDYPCRFFRGNACYLHG